VFSPLTPLANFHQFLIFTLIFDPTPFGSLRLMTLNPHFFGGRIIFDVRLFYLCPLTEESN
jgi:hypothetical protein